MTKLKIEKRELEALMFWALIGAAERDGGHLLNNLYAAFRTHSSKFLYDEVKFYLPPLLKFGAIGKTLLKIIEQDPGVPER